MAEYKKLLNELGITQDQFNKIQTYCDFNTNAESTIGFESEETGQWVYNIFLDESARFDLSLEQAVNTWGKENVKNFCKDVLEILEKSPYDAGYAAGYEQARWYSDNEPLKDADYKELITNIGEDYANGYKEGYNKGVEENK